MKVYDRDLLPILSLLLLCILPVRFRTAASRLIALTILVIGNHYGVCSSLMHLSLTPPEVKSAQPKGSGFLGGLTSCPFPQRRINNKPGKGSEHPFHACPRLTSRERFEYSIGDRSM
jgi:hypothetical protein